MLCVLCRGQLRLTSPGPDAGVSATMILPVLQKATDRRLYKAFSCVGYKGPCWFFKVSGF
jgi:hypothetical protein